jgi:hypothetical protein
VSKLLVSILHYNNPVECIETVTSFRSQTVEGMSLQVFDNASRPDTVAQIRTAYPDVRIVASPSNLGYTGGNNAALEQGLREGYDHVIISNEDIEVDPSAFASLVETANRHSDAGIVGAVETCFFTGEVRAAGGGGFSLWRARELWRRVLPESSASEQTVAFVQGALVLVTRRALEAGVRLDDRLFIYYDEIDLGLQNARAGLAVYLAPSVTVRHKNKPRHMNARAAYLHQRNRYYLVRKYGHWYHRVVYGLYSSLAEVPVKAVVRASQGHRQFAKACVMGHVDGIRGVMGIGRLSTI